MKSFLIVALALLTVHAQDPAPSWLAYFNAQVPNGITNFSCSVVVPAEPAEAGAIGAFWPGIEPNPQLNLLQPILKWLGNEWAIFNEYFRWSDRYDYQSTAHRVHPGDVVHMSIVLDATTGDHVLSVQSGVYSHTTRFDSKSTQYKKFTEAYIVVEHQPQSCQAYPPGQPGITFSNVTINGASVTWSAVKGPGEACQVVPVVISDSVLTFTWSN